MQNAIGTAIYCHWLGGLTLDGQSSKIGELLTLDQVGAVFKGTYMHLLHPTLSKHDVFSCQ
jgi:hypothetical protein